MLNANCRKRRWRTAAIVALIGAGIVFSTDVRADVRFCNGAAKPIRVVVYALGITWGKCKGGPKTFEYGEVNGWFLFEPRECRNVFHWSDFGRSELAKTRAEASQSGCTLEKHKYPYIGYFAETDDGKQVWDWPSGKSDDHAIPMCVPKDVGPFKIGAPTNCGLGLKREAHERYIILRAIDFESSDPAVAEELRRGGYFSRSSGNTKEGNIFVSGLRKILLLKGR